MLIRIKELPDDVDDILTPEAIEGILAKEALLKMGDLPPSGGDITAGLLHSCTFREAYWSGSAIFVRTEYHTRASLPHAGMQRAYEKSVTQMKDANIGVDSPRLEEPVSETSFTYPTDKVVNIQRGRKLNRRT